MEPTVRLLRDALRHLSLEPDEQRAALADTVVTDELALDLNSAMSSLQYAMERAEVQLGDDLLSNLLRLDRLLSASPDDSLWDQEALDRHPTWAEARTLARVMLPLLPDPLPGR